MAGRWLMKTEPEEWSWDHQQANEGISQWDGVRNALAQKHLRAMELGDLCLFYHSGAKAKEIVGIARVCKTFYPDPTDALGKNGMVDIEAVSKLSQPLGLARLKEEDGLSGFIMFRQPRLSVLPVSMDEWNLICDLAGQLEPLLLTGRSRECSVDLDDRVVEQENLGGSAKDAARVSQAEPKPVAADHKADATDRASTKSAQCDNKIDDEVTSVVCVPSHIKKQRGKRKAVSNVENLKDDEPFLPVAASSAASSQQQEVDLSSKAQNNSFGDDLKGASSSPGIKEDFGSCIPPNSLVTKSNELVPISKRVYSRRSRKGVMMESGT